MNAAAGWSWAARQGVWSDAAGQDEGGTEVWQRRGNCGCGTFSCVSTQGSMLASIMYFTASWTGYYTAPTNLVNPEGLLQKQRPEDAQISTAGNCPANTTHLWSLKFQLCTCCYDLPLHSAELYCLLCGHLLCP